MNSEAVVFFHDKVHTETRVTSHGNNGYTLNVQYYSEGQRFETTLFFKELRSLVEAVCSVHSKVLDCVVNEWEHGDQDNEYE